MRISLDDISYFSRCPKLFSLVKDTSLSVDKRLLVVQQVVQKAYTATIETGFRVQWRRIVGWVDTLIFQDIDINNEESFKVTRIAAEQILSFLMSWYHIIYLNDNAGGFPGVKIEQPVGDRFLVYDFLLAVKPDNIPTILYIDDINRTRAKIFNDIKLRGQAWLLSKSMGSSEIMLQCLCFKPKGGFGFNEVYIEDKDNQNMEEILLQIASSISCNIDYPSVSEDCNICRLKNRCRI